MRNVFISTYYDKAWENFYNEWMNYSYPIETFNSFLSIQQTTYVKSIPREDISVHPMDAPDINLLPKWSKINKAIQNIEKKIKNGQQRIL